MNETICAVATAHGIGSVSIIRISGTNSLSIAKRLSHADTFAPRYATLLPVYAADNSIIDEAIFLYFKAPHSFTGEDIVEVQCHGGFVVAQLVLKTVLGYDARLANPGEFSKRAFLNDKIDLSKAEAIAALIEAKSDDAVKILAAQLRGSLGRYVDNIRDELLYILAYSEVSIDYAEEDLPKDLIEQMISKLNTLHASLADTLQASKSREGLMQGFKVSIVGRPNVGKSSLLNMLLNYNRAIVSEIAGTTRDTIEESVKIGTHLVRIIDTAGIRKADDEIERIGIQRSIEAIDKSDIVIALFDNSRAFDDEDAQILRILKQYKTRKEIITILNKIDLDNNFDLSKLSEFDYIKQNSKENARKLMDKLQAILDKNNFSDETMLVSLRQIEAVSKAMQAITDAKQPLLDQELEIFSFCITEAIHAISSITKTFENDEMLDKMFGSFCLGK